MKAKRGDLVVVSMTVRDYVIGEASTVRERHEVHEVSGITRDGIVTRTRSSWGGFTTEQKANPSARYTVIPAADVDVDAVKRAVMSHHYEGHEGQTKPYNTLDEVRAVVRPHLRATRESASA